MKIKIVSLGCKVNSVESESITQLFISHNHQIVNDNADVVVINTCCVTGEAESKSRQAIRRAIKDGSKVAVMGCYGQLSPQSLKDIGADIVIGTSNRKSIVDLVEDIFFAQNPINENLFEELPHLPSKTRAFIKIQDGCNGQCTYCIIPTVRGHSRSRSLDSIKRECQSLSDYKEIVLTGINLGMYGKDINSNLIEAINLVLDNSSARIRLSSIEPTEINDELIDFICNEPRICNHLHIPVQSLSDSVLRDMNRPYNSNDFIAMVNKFKSKIPNFAIGIDIILGFPTETDELFNESFTLLEQLPINHFHVFNYSQRSGTPAADMIQLNPIIRKDRVQKVLTLANHKNLAYRQSLINSEVEVLTEVFKDNFVEGHCSEYVKVFIDDDVSLNEIIKVKLTDIHKEGMIGRIIL